MDGKQRSVLVVGPSVMLYRTMEALKVRFNYRVRYAYDPFEASNLIENTAFDALVCEVAPAYTAECRLVREISHRSRNLPVFLFAAPEDEEHLLDELAHGGFHVVRWTTPLEEFHRLLDSTISRHQHAKVA